MTTPTDVLVALSFRFGRVMKPAGVLDGDSVALDRLSTAPFFDDCLGDTHDGL